MKPLQSLTRAEAQALDGLLFDLDDTVLDHGQLSEAAYSALFRLRESGLRLIAVTGRPAAWGELVARQWPTAAVVAENGALAWKLAGGRAVLLDPATPEERAQRRARLAALVDELRRQVPALVPADDVGGRISDYTFDIGEHQRAAEETIQRALTIARDAGATSFRSSVHLHVSYDSCDKATGTLALLAREFAVDPTAARARYAYVGDSENDAACFAFFRMSVGVANLQGRYSLPPRYRTAAPRGAGFAELGRRLVELRAGG